MVWVRVGRDVGQRLECRYGMFIEIRLIAVQWNSNGVGQSR